MRVFGCLAIPASWYGRQPTFLYINILFISGCRVKLEEIVFMKKCLILLAFLLIGTVGYSQIIDETIPIFMEKVVAKTSKAEVVNLLKEKKFEIKSKEYMQNTQFMSNTEADNSVMGVGNYGITCIRDFFGYGRVYMKANYTTNEGIMQELAKSGYKWSHRLDGRAVYTKNHSDGYQYTIFANPVNAQNGTVWGMFEMVREENDTYTSQINPADRKTAEQTRTQEEKRRQAEENERKRIEAEEIRKQADAISNRTSNAFGSVSSQDTRQGNASTGANPSASPFSGSSQGGGISGSFNLNGRSIGSGGLPQPRCGNEDGKVVVNITVAPNGNVIEAEIGRGTNIESIITQECALEAAERARFNRIQGSNNQSGTITYIFRDIGATSNQADNVQGISLDGRSLIGRLPQPAYRSQEQGRIVVNITVNPNGDVIRAEIGRDTTIDNANARNSALEAAKKAKYNRIQGTTNQSGTIIYNYGLR